MATGAAFALLLSTGAAQAAGGLPTDATLRGYGRVVVTADATAKLAATVKAYHVQCADPAHALVFASKLLSDYQVLGRNKQIMLKVAGGTVPAIQAPEGWVIAVAARRSDAKVDIICAGSAAEATSAASVLKIAAAVPAAITDHPIYMDKWDRYCFGLWFRPNDAESVKMFKDAAGKPDADAFYKWAGARGLVLQGANFFSLNDGATDPTGYSTSLPYMRKYRIPYQFAAWLPVSYDLHNRNPKSTSNAAAGFTPIHSYYGDIPNVPSVLENAQNDTYLQALKQVAGDDSYMTVLEPHGEVGPFPTTFVMMQSPEGRADLIRFLRDERKYSLTTLSTRWFGKPNALASWDAVQFPDQRRFYGWNDATSQDLGGTWRTHADADRKGDAAGWGAADFDDSKWRSVNMPGDQTVNFRNSAAWFRVRFDASKTITTGGKVYLNVIDLNYGWRENPGYVYLNGTKVGELRMRDWHEPEYMQFDVTSAIKPTGNVLSIMTTQGSFAGPLFLTTKPMEDFPTSDPQINLQKVDLHDWVAYAIGTSMRRSMQYLRTIAPNQPAKFHAVTSEWADRAMQDYGGFPHCTGEGAFWRPFDKHYGIPRGLQDSSEPGGSAPDLPGLKNLFSAMWMEGMNAHDYFHDPESILNDPDQTAYFEKMLPYMKLMGATNLNAPKIAVLMSRRSPRYQGGWKMTPREDSASTVFSLHRGFAYIDEAGIEDNLISPYPVIIDDATECWDPEMTAKLTAYVHAGGTMLLPPNSGRHTYRDADAWPSAALTGCRVTSSRLFPYTSMQIEAAPSLMKGVAGVSFKVYNAKKLTTPTIELGPGVEVLATFPDKSPALVRCTVGKGQIIWALAPEILRDEHILGPLLDSLNIPAHSDTQGRSESFVSNDGTEEMLVLTTRGRGDQTVRLAWSPGFTPKRIYDPVTGDEIPATVTGDKAVFADVPLQQCDLRFYATRRPVTANAAFEHWWTRQTQIWQGTGATVAPPASAPFRSIDLSNDWTFAQVHSPTALDTLLKLPIDQQAAKLSPTRLTLWKAAGLPTGADERALYRKSFTLTPAWLANSKQDLNLGTLWPYNGLPAKGELRVNDTKVADLNDLPWRGRSFDITALLKPGANRIDVLTGGNGNDGGLCGTFSLKRTVAPRKVIDLGGEWRGVVSEDSEVAVNLPGTFKGVTVYRDYAAPADLQGKDVWIRARSTDPNSTAWVSVNGRVRYMSTFGTRGQAELPLEINITPDLVPGKVNRILLGTAGFAKDDWKLVNHVYQSVELVVYNPGDW
ncbi:MAG TPA: hypothetical protein VGK19_24425 [Capsulimonadaceae bacterium]|jgi:hypothetical protein